MTSTKQTRAGLTSRDRKLLLAFAFFVEGVLLYMLMIDPLITRLGQARQLEETSRRAHAELSAAVAPAKPAPLQAVPEAALTPLPLAPNESPTVAIQGALDRMAQLAGVRLGQATIDPQSETRGGLLTHAVKVEVSGPYEAVTAFVRDMEARDPVRGIEIFSIATAEADLDAVSASLTLRFFLEKR